MGNCYSDEIIENKETVQLRLYSGMTIISFMKQINSGGDSREALTFV
jgi:hypothetical protein